MTNIKEQTIPTAYSREVNVESTLKYMGEVITFLVLGNALVLIEPMSESLQSKVTLFHSSASGGPRQILFFCPFIVRNFDCELAASIRSAPHRNYWFASRRCLC